MAIISINGYVLNYDDITDFYPCNILGYYEEDNERWTFIRYNDKSKGIYRINYKELLATIKKRTHN